MESDVRILNCCSVSAVCLLAGLVVTPPASAKPIDAVKGKTYKLTKKHGPWMVMVASFHEPPPERKGEGISPEEAANALVYELRMKGIPAYSFSQEDVVDEIQTTDRKSSSPRIGKYIAQQGSICVLAGNYPSADDKIAQKTRDYIKRFQPELLKAEEATGPGGVLHKLKNGGIYRTTPGRPGPLAGAFLTINPLLSAEEIKGQAQDPLLLQLNSDKELSLLQNEGKYTVVVASFYGRSKTQFGKEIDESAIKVDDRLYDVAQSAWELATALRKARSLGYDQDYEAYVYHDRYGSVVTVGSFNSLDDPGITKLQNHFGAKVAAVNTDGSSALGAETFTIPRKVSPKVRLKSWIFDPYPKVMEVPTVY